MLNIKSTVPKPCGFKDVFISIIVLFWKKSTSIIYVKQESSFKVIIKSQICNRGLCLTLLLIIKSKQSSRRARAILNPGKLFKNVQMSSIFNHCRGQLDSATWTRQEIGLKVMKRSMRELFWVSCYQDYCMELNNLTRLSRVLWIKKSCQVW